MDNHDIAVQTLVLGAASLAHKIAIRGLVRAYGYGGCVYGYVCITTQNRYSCSTVKKDKVEEGDTGSY